MSTTITARLGDIQKYAFNPTAIQRVTMEALRQVIGGNIDVVDATNPFVFAIETSVVNTAAFMQQAEALTRRQYAASATSVADLYLHMADADYSNIFAVPSKATFTLLINKKQLLAALLTDPATGISSVTIPRNSVFYATTIAFSLQYPVTIRMLQHGDLQVVYDASVVSPLQTLTTNVIERQVLTDPAGTEFISFDLELQQFNVIERVNDVNSTGGFVTTVNFTNHFYYARVYASDSNGGWRELPVTYTEQVYDLSTPVAVISVVDKKAIVTIPVVYTTTGQISGKVRIDIYETLGPMSMLLGNFSPNDFKAEFKNLNKQDDTRYSAAFTSITGVAVYSKDLTSGGRHALTFEELQTRVINNSLGSRKIPITPSQIQTTLIDQGYTLVKNVDSVMNRIYWATKPLPVPTSPNLVTPANASVVSLITNLDHAELAHGCAKHATGMTITTAALISTVQGVSTLVSKSSYAALLAKPLPDLCATINQNHYHYSPFYYVLEISRDAFNVRPYYLDLPVIKSRNFVRENPATNLQASIASNYAFVKTEIGYLLSIPTNSNAAYQDLADGEVFCQLSFMAGFPAKRAYALGIQRPRVNNAGERVFDFTLTTNYDIDAEHRLVQLTCQYATGNMLVRSALLQDVTVVFGTTSSLSGAFHSSDIDAYLGVFQLKPGAIGITQESLKLQFGYHLPTLWNRYRSIVAPIPYQTHLTDVIRTYSKDVYETDAATGAAFSIGPTGSLVYHKQHSAGDQVRTASGEPVYSHRVGDPIIDAVTNLPRPVAGYETRVNRLLEMVVLDGSYQFANDAVTTNYLNEIDLSLVKALTDELASINKEVLEQTEIYYYPAVTKGMISVIADDNQVLSLEAAQKFQVTLYVAPTVYQDTSLTTALSNITITTIGAYLANNYTVSVSQLEEVLSKAYGGDVLGVKATGLGGSKNYAILTVTDESTLMSISKSLSVLPNNHLAVKEDISIVFELHTQNR